MTGQELYERIKLTLEAPPCVIDSNLRNCYADWDNETEVLVALPGVAVWLNGYNTFDARLTDRKYRAELTGMSWYELMHCEQALSMLFDGRTFTYNQIAWYVSLPQAKILKLPVYNETCAKSFMEHLKLVLS
jgi:hypothetical protein